ncbi:MAG: crotonase/enoyl-CoA hydratase family protein [Gammaproteobacteria bacterium]|nr:crotonase/enoyl-CoA hydratase family protein [Gammaproteobacteria bacterium]
MTIDIADGIWSIAINRPRARNALNGAAMQQLKSAFRAFDNEDSASVAVLSGRGGSFCAGADLKEMADAANYEAWAGDLHGMLGAPLSKPLIGAVEGHAVAGGLGVALYCDVRIASSSAVFGVFCRRFGVPMSDGSTIRLPRLIGESRALDMMLSGRAVQAEEAQNIGLVASVVPEGQAHSAAMEYARRLTVFPQLALRSDRQSLLEQSGHDLRTALRNETRLAATAKAQQAQSGAQAFAAGIGRHGQNSD